MSHILCSLVLFYCNALKSNVFNVARNPLPTAHWGGKRYSIRSVSISISFYTLRGTNQDNGGGDGAKIWK